MTTQELEQAILDVMVNDYGYVSGLTLEDLGSGYKVKLDLHNYMVSLVIMAEIEAEKFLKYFKEELRERCLHHASYFTGFKRIKEDEEYSERLWNDRTC